MARESKESLKGPLSKVALAAFTKHLSALAGRPMVLDPESHGHEIYDENRARYQWKVEGGRSSDDQGVVLRASGDPEVWFVRHNVVWAGFHVRLGRTSRGWGLPGDEDVTEKSSLSLQQLVLERPARVLPYSFGTALAEFMESYEGPI